MKNYITEMNKCIELAKQAEGKTSPNPMVGCVILNDKNEIISTGYHKKYGENHAERDALLKLENATGCTLVVNLEPCSHFGKTPPCADLIIEKGIKRVIYGMKDVNPIVAGNGLKKLQEAGIEIIGPILEDKCKKLNEVFIKNQTKHKTFVALKTATTIDGKIATQTGDSKWITSEDARREVRNIRNRYDAILTSSATLIADNPTMEHKFKCILDKDERIEKNAQIFKQGEIYLATQNNTPLKNGSLDIKAVLKELYKKGIYTVFVECGGTLAGSMLKDGLIDEIYQFIAPKILNDNGGKSCFNGEKVDKICDAKNLNIYDVEKIGVDILIKAKIQ